MSGLAGYGFVSDSDESLKSKTGVKFGGNFGICLLTKFAYNANVAKEGDPARDAIEIVVKIGDKEMKEWINPVTKVVNKDNQEITDKTSPEYIQGFNLLMAQQGGLVTHYLKSTGVTEEQIKNILTASPVTGFADYAQRVCSLLPAGYDKAPKDIFLEFQWNLGKKQDGTMYDRTFPTLPRNMKGGYFIVAAQPGVWVEERTETGGLVYKNSNGAEHPFEKSADFMKSHKGTMQTLGGAAPSAMSAPQAGAGAPAGNGAATPGGW